MNKNIYLLVIIYQLFIACSNKTENQNINVINTVKNVSGIIADSIRCDINKDGKLDKISIIELTDSTRLLLVEINEDNRFKIIASNKKIIGCKTCGYQSGDPFVHIDSTSNGFILYMEYGQVTFFYESGSIYLDKINLSITKQTEDGIEESHEIFLHQKFGKFNLSDLKEGYILTIKNKLKKTQSVLVDSIKKISIKDAQLIFTQFDKEFNLWYSPRLIINSDTLIISELSNENGSELSINESPNGNFFVMDNIIKGYIENEKGEKILYENFNCVIINLKEAKVEQSLQSECDGTWNNQNEWVSGGRVIFNPN